MKIKIDTDIYNANKFKSIPEFICPQCHAGTLIFLDDKDILSKEPQSTRDYREETLEIDELYYFTGILTCNTCGEISIISGTKSSTRNYQPAPYHPDYNKYLAYEKVGMNYIVNGFEYQISFISPTPYIIDLPEELLTSQDYLHTSIKAELMKSFELFWIDNDSCANKIRNVLELIMDFRESKQMNGIKYNKMSLTKRIKEIQGNDEILHNILTVIKLIGNHGSHGSKNISREDLIKTYQILEYCINEFFSQKKEGALAIATDLDSKYKQYKS